MMLICYDSDCRRWWWECLSRSQLRYLWYVLIKLYWCSNNATAPAGQLCTTKTVVSVCATRASVLSHCVIMYIFFYCICFWYLLFFLIQLGTNYELYLLSWCTFVFKKHSLLICFIMLVLWDGAQCADRKLVELHSKKVISHDTIIVNRSL